MATKLQNLRAGVIGTGFIGPVHIEALLRLGVKVTAVCDDTAPARAVARRFGIPNAIGDRDYRSLIASPDVDVVHIASPNKSHYEHALAALRAGKHCVCEKPLAMTTQQTAKLVAAAEKSEGVLAVNYNIRFYPAVQQMRKLVARGEFGEIIHVNGSYFQDWLLHDTDYNWRLLPKEGGRLRAVADIGTHWMDLTGFILGQSVDQVFAELQIHHKRRKRPLGEIATYAKAGAKVRYKGYEVRTEDAANVLLHYEDGTRGNLAVSQVAAGRKNRIRIEIYGSRQSASWCSEEPETLHFGHRDVPNQTAFRGTPSFGPDIAQFVDYPPGHVEGFPDTFKMNFRAIYDAISRGKRSGLFASAQDGHNEVALCEAILKSHRSKSWTRVS